MKCASVRRKGGTEQCTSPAVRGHTMCGRHAKSTRAVLWADVHRPRRAGIVSIQACVRGWLVRTRLALGGPGCLSRTDLATDEELVTCVDKTRQHPFDYFGFEENDKIWWFDTRTLWTWSLHSHEPTNPYTKVPLSRETRLRLRAAWAYRQRRRLPLSPESSEYTQRLRARWTAVSQVVGDYGFSDGDPAKWMTLGQRELRSMFTILERDLQAVLPDSDPGKARALRLCRRGLNDVRPVHPSVYVLWAAYTILLLLTIHKDPYSMTFSVMSALHRC